MTNPIRTYPPPRHGNSPAHRRRAKEVIFPVTETTPMPEVD